MGKVQGYSGLQIAAHWITAVLVVFNYIYSDGMGRELARHLGMTVDRPAELNPQIHVWVGVAVLVLTIVRIGMRSSRGAPDAPGAELLVLAALWGHRLIYALLLLVPVLGGLAWFGGVSSLGDVHALVANGLMIVAGGHAVMALFHQYVLKDHLLLRMMRAQ